MDTIIDIIPIRSYGSVINTTKNKAYSNFTTGLAEVDLNSSEFTPILYKNKPVYGSKIAIDTNGIVWVATYNEGVYGFKNNTLVYKFNLENGLASHVINAIEVGPNSIWVATDKGLQNYNYSTNKSVIIDRQDGVNSYNINAIKVLGNQVFFSSNTGLFQFDSNKVNKSRATLNPYFTGVAIQEKDTILTTSYQLKQTDSEIKISFNVNGFQSQYFTNYEYQLDGFNPKWIPVEDGLDFVKFNTLPEGDYKFNLRAKNSTQRNFSKPITINLSITSPFYKTWWFLALIFGLISLLIFLFYRQKTKQLQAKQQQELENAKINQQLVFSQLENLRSQMNPHFIFNALNSIQDYIILNEKKLARVYLVKFSRLIRTYLEHSQKNEGSLQEEIKALKLYLELEQDRFDDDFKFDIYIDPQLNLDRVYVPSLFIQPYVENALKHCLLHKKEDKKLQLNFIKDKTKNNLVCEIIDNGIGRIASAEINKKRTEYHKPFASNANQKRVNLLNKSQQNTIEVLTIDLYDKNQNALGTEVSIEIQLKKPTKV
jgi:two-component sensor histidine kinase